MANREVHGTEIPTEVLDHEALAFPLKHYAQGRPIHADAYTDRRRSL
jgi:hypothetical protein